MAVADFPLSHEYHDGFSRELRETLIQQSLASRRNATRRVSVETTGRPLPYLSYPNDSEAKVDVSVYASLSLLIDAITVLNIAGGDRADTIVDNIGSAVKAVPFLLLHDCRKIRESDS